MLYYLPEHHVERSDGEQRERVYLHHHRQETAVQHKLDAGYDIQR